MDELHSAAPRVPPRILCVVGPTSSGKTKLSVRLAHELGGEIVNADARQMYRGFTIGTGKPAGERRAVNGVRAYVSDGIPHYLMDCIDSDVLMTVAEWREKAMRAVRGITSRSHVPIVVGGTGLYIRALVDNLQFPNVEPKPKLREAFQKKTLEELVRLLVAIDPYADKLVDLKNPRRVIRALEVATFTGKPFTAQQKMGKPLVDAIQIGVKWPREELYARIDRAVDSMIERGWVEEVCTLREAGVREDSPAMTSIGYREMLWYTQGKLTLTEAREACKKAVHRYAKRQETWFKRDPRIHWFATADEAFAFAVTAMRPVLPSESPQHVEGWQDLRWLS